MRTNHWLKCHSSRLTGLRPLAVRAEHGFSMASMRGLVENFPLVVISGLLDDRNRY
jgi:hypothetical protein